MHRVLSVLLLVAGASITGRSILHAQLPVTTADTLAYFQKLDENRDGALTGSEQMFCILCSYKDWDGDGGVTLNELRGIGVDATAEARARSGVLETRTDSIAYFTRLDSDRDGFLAGSEKMFCIACGSRSDPDGDGRVSQAEFLAQAIAPAPAAAGARSAPPVGPARPAPGTAQPNAPEVPPPAAFAAGGRVEVQYLSGKWALAEVTHVSGGADCPFYRVNQDPHGNGAYEMSYPCGSVRLPSAQASRSPEAAGCGGSRPNCPPKAPPPLGSYGCSQTVWRGPGVSPAYRSEPRGSITLLAGGRYRMFDNGRVGSYRYDPTTHRIRWSGGDMEIRGGIAQYGLDGSTPEITITFETDYTRQTGNEPVRWQCGLR